MSMETFAGMTASVATWLNREGFSALEAQIPDLIAIAQRRIHRECDLNAMEEAVELTIDAQTVPTPERFLRTKSLFLVQGSGMAEIQGADHHAVMHYGAPGRPLRYSVIGPNFFFSPAPDATYAGRLVYFKALDILSEATPTNWLSENAPELLLYGALMEASMFLKDDQRAQVWEARYQGVRQALLLSEERMDKPYGELRVRAL